MFGYEFIAIETSDGLYNLHETGLFTMCIKDYNDSKFANKVYNAVHKLIKKGDTVEELKDGVSLEYIREIAKANTSNPNAVGDNYIYHKYASDGVTVIPKTKDKLIRLSCYGNRNE